MKKVLALILVLALVPVMALADEVVSLVVECDPVGANLWEVTCLTEDGDLFGFYEDVEPWDVGDVAELTLIDEEVVEVFYVEHLDEAGVVTWFLR